MNIEIKKFKTELSNDLGKKPSNNLFNIKPANDWIDDAMNRPIPKMLFGELWFEGELCILFADTNLGKSILAVQIANSISSGISTCGLQLEANPQSVIYVDFELSDKQFECRYSDDYENHFDFNSNFLRAEIEIGTKVPPTFKTFEEYLFDSLEKIVTEHSSKVLIIDNMTYLKNGTEKANEAVPLMHFLNDLKKKHKLSILVLAHTPKRDGAKPISKNDVSGSKILMNFCDSSFAIGESSNGSNARYLKQIKQRFVENIYGLENVIICSIEKDINFLKFSFMGYDNELNHLKERTRQDFETRDEKIIQLKNEGKSNVEIGRMLGISEGTVRKELKKFS